MAEFPVTLEEDLNPEYYELFRESNDITDTLNVIRGDLMRLRTPAVRIWRVRTPLRQIGQRLLVAEHRTDDWFKRMSDFGIQPHFKFGPGTEKAIAYLHYSAVARHRTEAVKSNLLYDVGLYNYRSALLKERRDFLIAISSAFVSLLGLVFALLH